jgi:hypothetical protein
MSNSPSDVNSCDLNLSVGGSCAWIVNENNNGGGCEYSSSVSCTSFNEVQCIYNSANSLGCFWDNTDLSGVCKTKNINQCYNEIHYSPQEGICQLKLCSDRTSNSKPTNPCESDNCYYDSTDEDGKCKPYSNNDGTDAKWSNSAHYKFDKDSKSCVEKLCSDRTSNSELTNSCGSDDCVFVRGWCNTNPCYRENSNTYQRNEL